MSSLRTLLQRTFLCTLFLFLGTAITPVLAQGGGEICNNGIDDDGDGQIDLNDTDCLCQDIVASSLIPNPSFENMSCCPTGEAELFCADSWVQASAPTTDYVHTCGVLGNPFLGFEAPVPFPDGEGAIGFRDGRPNQPNYKEYTGACLTETMTVGTQYRLDFFVGFHDAFGSTSFDMAIFGTANCGRIPFGDGDFNHGCPLNGPGFVQLGEMTVSGTNEWKNVVFDFIADDNFEAIVLGPACAENPNFNNDPYFYFDRLVLAESIMFEVPLVEINGNICEGAVELISSDGMGVGATYQWYKDGIAIVGETNMNLIISETDDVEGTYEVVVTTDTGCFNGEQYDLIIPNYTEALEEQICDGETIIIGDEEFSLPGNYSVTLTAADGCDSIVNLALSVGEGLMISIEQQICFGEEFEFNGIVYDTSGTFTQTVPNTTGCDDIYTLILDFLDPVVITVEETICEGEVLDLNGISYDVAGDYEQENISPETGCLETTLLTLNVLPMGFQEESFEICEGESITVNGITYTEAGSFDQDFITAEGCEGTLQINIAFSSAFTVTENYSICEGQTVEVNGVSYGTEGAFLQELISAEGCDSILTINVTVDPVITAVENFAICEGQSIDVNGVNYNSEGEFIQELISEEGCDSILTVNVSVDPAFFEIQDFTLCDGETVVINGETFGTAGSFMQDFVTASGCDSTVTINITLNPAVTSQQFGELCEGDSFIFDGQTITEGGIYTQNLTSVAGCDSTIVLDVILNPAFNEIEDVEICEGESFSWHGNEYSTSGTFTEANTTINGCDSIATLNLLVNPGFASIDNIAICEGESYEFNGESLEESGTYIADLQTAAGCDSISTLILQVNPTSNRDVEYWLCEGDTLNLNGTDYYENGMFEIALSNQFGCDSIVNVNIVLEYACRTCIFDQDLTDISIQISKIGQNEYGFDLYNENIPATQLSLSKTELEYAIAIYAIEDDLFYETGELNKSLLVKDAMAVIFEESRRSIESIDLMQTSLLLYPEQKLNAVRASYHFEDIKKTIEQLPVGASSRHRLR